MDERALIKMALEARNKAYAPYSGFSVGAALYAKSGRIYTGCNIENASYPAGNCAERTALFKAVSEGEREFVAIAIAGGPANEDPNGICSPCGICRQVLGEFCSDDFIIILAASGDSYETYSLGGLFPLGFKL